MGVSERARAFLRTYVWEKVGVEVEEVEKQQDHRGADHPSRGRELEGHEVLGVHGTGPGIKMRNVNRARTGTISQERTRRIGAIMGSGAELTVKCRTIRTYPTL